jgi:dihydrofolate reductase
MISIIVAIAENFAIGCNNDLLVHLPEDLKRFKRITTGHTVIMGKRTYESLPKRPLPNRVNMVITDNPEETFEGCITAYSIVDAIEKCNSSEENFIIGGGMVYRQFYPIADRLYLTIIHQSFEADTYFPEINYSEWNVIEKEKQLKSEVNPVDYTYLILERKK